MKTTEDYIRDLHAHYGTHSTYALAKSMGLGDQTVRGWTKGHSFSEAHALLVAEILGVDPGEVLAASAAARSKCPQARAVWARIADQYSGHAAGLALSVAALPYLPDVGHLVIMLSCGSAAMAALSLAPSAPRPSLTV